MAGGGWLAERPEKLGDLYQRLGRTGFWIQVVVLVVAGGLSVWLLLMRPQAADAPPALGFRNFISLASLLILAFTTYWFRRYARVGARMADPATRPGDAELRKLLWTGLWAGALGVGLSLFLMLGSVGRMMILMLSNPQVGVMLAPGVGAEQSISAVDALGQMALLLMMGAELIALALTLWLLFRTQRPAERDA